MYENLGERISAYADKAIVNEKILGALGLARRAGKLVTGAEMCEEAIREGKAEIAFIASDLSDNAVRKLTNALQTYGVPYIRLSATKEALAARIGKKAFTAAAVIIDKGLAEIVFKALGQEK